MKTFRRTLLAALSVAAFAASFQAAAQDFKPRIIRFGYGLNEASNQGRATKLFAEEVEKASGGKMRVRAIGAAALGSDLQMQQALIGGAQEMMVGSTATLVGITKEMAIWDTPFLFNNAKEADVVLDEYVARADRAAQAGSVKEMLQRLGDRLSAPAFYTQQQRQQELARAWWEQPAPADYPGAGEIYRLGDELPSQQDRERRVSKLVTGAVLVADNRTVMAHLLYELRQAEPPAAGGFMQRHGCLARESGDYCAQRPGSGGIHRIRLGSGHQPAA